MNWALIIGIGLGMILSWLIQKIYNHFRCEHEWIEIPDAIYAILEVGKPTKLTTLMYCRYCWKTKKKKEKK